MRTLFLNPSTWDLTVDANGNIAVADEPYQYAQDVASACKLWKGEAKYNAVRGIPYKESLLGMLPPPSLIAKWYQEEAATIENVETIDVIVNYDKTDRSLGGSISFTTVDGEQLEVRI